MNKTYKVYRGATPEGVQGAIGKPPARARRRGIPFVYIRPICLRDFASAEATKGLSDRPLETFGASAPYRQIVTCIIGKLT